MADKEYIEREATLHRMKVEVRPPFAVVRDMPAADVVEVVRCKDCNWFDPRYLDEDGTFWCEHTGFGRVTRYDYCSNGARKKG